MRLGRSAAGILSVIVSVSPRTPIPATCCDRAARYAATPAMSDANAAATAFGPSRGDSARSIVYLKVSAVTGSFDGGEKRKPRRIRKEYVRPSADTVGGAAASSGATRQPAGA